MTLGRVRLSAPTTENMSNTLARVCFDYFKISRVNNVVKINIASNSYSKTFSTSILKDNHPTLFLQRV
jgi:hypothetical protein